MNKKSNLTQKISSRAYVAESAEIGANSGIDIGAFVPGNVRIGNSVIVGPNVTFEETPSSDASQKTLVGDNVVIGAGAVIRAGLTISAGSQVCPGAVVSRSVPQGAIVDGNPAQIVGYVNAQPALSTMRAQQNDTRENEVLAVKGVKIIEFPIIPDLRGMLTVGEFDKQIPFTPKRYFMVYGVPNKEVRGEHAHHECHQFLICLNGNCTVVADDGHQKVEVVLDSPSKGLYLPPMTWGIQYKYSENAVLLVFASHYYDANDYIRDYESFLKLAKNDSSTQ